MRTREKILHENYEKKYIAEIVPKKGKECPFFYKDKLIPLCCNKCPYYEYYGAKRICSYFNK